MDAGDPDEDLSGEDVLFEIALGRTLPVQAPTVPRCRRNQPFCLDDAELTHAEIRQRAFAHASVNLAKLTLHRFPPI